MAKRHTTQDTKQALGQYFTTNADTILSGWESVVKGKRIIDPFSGGGDLLNWAKKHGAVSTQGYDLAPQDKVTEQRDSLLNPPDFEDCVLITNPPYLAANKCKGDKTVFTQWDASDYYKCHLASISGCPEAIEILPANFLCESRSAARDRLFKTHHIVSAKIWTTPVFEDTTSCICALHLKLGQKPVQKFPLEIYPTNTVVDVELHEKHGWLWGDEFFEYIDVKPIAMLKTDQGMSPPNTKIVVSLLDKGAWPVGLSINMGDPLYCPLTTFTTYQLTIPDYDLALDKQQQVVELFNQKLVHFRNQYNDLFLANYMGPGQKILSRDYVHRLITRCMMDLDVVHTSDSWGKFFY